jgi:hypothetical protein
MGHLGDLDKAVTKRLQSTASAMFRFQSRGIVTREIVSFQNNGAEGCQPSGRPRSSQGNTALAGSE